jgi:hypothetical protein
VTTTLVVGVGDIPSKAAFQLKDELMARTGLDVIIITGCTALQLIEPPAIEGGKAAGARTAEKDMPPDNRAPADTPDDV